MVELVAMNLIFFARVRITDLSCGFFFFVSFLTPVRIVVYSGIDGVGGDAGIGCSGTKNSGVIAGLGWS